VSGQVSPGQAGGISFAGMLGLLFIALKLVGAIAWSWWYVLAPVWIPIALVMLVMAFFTWLWAWYTFFPGDKPTPRPAGAPAAGQHGPAHRWPRRGR
jgi:hypothetical protein